LSGDGLPSSRRPLDRNSTWYDRTYSTEGDTKIPKPKYKARTFHPKLGQHFLHDDRYRNDILEELDLLPDDLVIEIGPGNGAMTGLLADRARRLIAIEIDRALAQKLEEDFEAKNSVRIIREDILNVDFAALCQQEGVMQSFVFGNLPYYITSPILHQLFAQRESVRSMALLMQREVADRLTAEPGSRDYGYLTVATQMFTRPEIVVSIPPGAFSPPPKVQSALVTFTMRAMFDSWTKQESDAFLEFVKACFAQKRKSLLNNLGGRFARTKLTESLANAGKTSTARAEELSVKELAALYQSLQGQN
jgi:16S rRNA (adenine1518-N6/adenine1519-N6)-dimethyltransferase